VHRFTKMKKIDNKFCLRGDLLYPEHYWGNYCKPFLVKGSTYAQYKMCLGCGLAEKRILDLRIHDKTQ